MSAQTARKLGWANIRTGWRKLLHRRRKEMMMFFDMTWEATFALWKEKEKEQRPPKFDVLALRQNAVEGGGGAHTIVMATFLISGCELRNEEQHWS